MSGPTPTAGVDVVVDSSSAPALRPAIAARNVIVEFSRRGHPPLRAVDDASFDLYPDEILGVVGESGSGKSTLGRVIAGFIEPTSGWVTTDLGGSAGGRQPKAGSGRPGVQMIFQESALALNPRMGAAKSIAEAITGGGTIRKRDVARAHAWLERVGLSSLQARRRPAELSGGQRQRVAIARALAAAPRVVVCDEAVSSLDVWVRADVVNLLADLRSEQRLSIVFISHDMSVVSQLADRVLVMNRGSIVETGHARQVIDTPQHEYTKRLLDAIPRLERTTRSG